jgi:hypothetical protein
MDAQLELLEAGITARALSVPGRALARSYRRPKSQNTKVKMTLIKMLVISGK